MSMRSQADQRVAVEQAIARHECAEAGPYGYVCTDRVSHDYAHYDATLDTSWTDRWYEDYSVPRENLTVDLTTDPPENPATS